MNDSWERIKAEALETIARVNKSLAGARDETTTVEPSVPPSENRGLAWRRRAEEREAAKLAEDERRQREWDEEIRARREHDMRAIAADLVAADREDRIKAMSKVIAALREETAERVKKLEAEIKTERSVLYKQHEAGIVNLPSKRVS